MADNNNINYNILDEDNLVSDSATSLATQQSLKAYVDSQTGSGGWEHISTQTASTVSSINFEGLDSTYAIYFIYWSNIRPATDSVTLTGRVGTGATPTYQTSGYKYAVFTNDYNGSSGQIGSTSAAQILLSYGATGNQSDENGSGIVTLYNPSSSTYEKDILSDHTRTDPTNIYGNDSVAGRYASNTAVTAFQMYYSSGNISTGTFKLYGLTGS